MDIINSEYCKRIQTDRLHAAEDKSIITFSINTEAASIFRVGNIPVTQIYGFISTEKQMWDSVVQDWLRHPDVFNLELTAISKRHNDQKIKDFLDDSRLADDGDDNAGIPGIRLRIDLCKPSGAPRAHKGGRPKKPVPASIGQPPLPPCTQSTAAAAAQTPPPPRRAAPSRGTTRTRIQYLASGPKSQANHAAADRAVALLDSLAPRLCLIQRPVDAGVELIAVLETAQRLEHEATKASLVTTSADAPGCSVRCVVDPDLLEEFGATVRCMVGRAGWAMRVERIRSPPAAAGTSTPNPTAPGGGGGGGGPTGGERAAEDPGAAADCSDSASEESEPGELETARRTCRPHIAQRYREVARLGSLFISVAAKAWSFVFSLGLPERNQDPNASAVTWVAQTLRDRLDPTHERKNSVLQVRFSIANLVPGTALCIHGFWELPSMVHADTLRAWLQVESSASTWKSHNGGAEQRNSARADWEKRAAALTDVTVRVLPENVPSFATHPGAADLSLPGPLQNARRQQCPFSDQSSRATPVSESRLSSAVLPAAALSPSAHSAVTATPSPGYGDCGHCASSPASGPDFFGYSTYNTGPYSSLASWPASTADDFAGYSPGPFSASWTAGLWPGYSRHYDSACNTGPYSSLASWPASTAGSTLDFSVHSPGPYSASWTATSPAPVWPGCDFGQPYALFLHQRLQSLHAAPDSLASGSRATRKRQHGGMARADGLLGLESCVVTCDSQVQSKKRRPQSAEIAWLDNQLAKQRRRAEEAEGRADREAALKKQARQDRDAAVRMAAKAGQRAETFHARLEASKGDNANLTARLRVVEKERDERCVTDVNGVRQPLHEVQLAQPGPGEVNVGSGQQGKRVAASFVASLNAGSLKVREGNIGGTEYTKLEYVLSMATDLEEGIGPKHSRGQRETNNLLRRARADGSKVEMVLPPRPGCTIRRQGPQGPVNPFPRPSEATMRLKIRPAFRLLMHRHFARLLEQAISINIVCDGKQFGPQHTVGTVVCIFIRDPSEETIDFFGNCIPVYKVLRMPMCLQQAPNKIAVDVVNTKTGAKYLQQSPFLCSRSLVLSFAHTIFLRYGFKLAFQLDAAADNRGTGELQRSMDSLSNPNSMHECITVTRRVWPATEEDLQKDGFLNVLLQFQAGCDLLQLTVNLKTLRLAQRYLQEMKADKRELEKKLRNLQRKESAETSTASAASSAASAQPAQPSPAIAGSDADQECEHGTPAGRLATPADLSADIVEKLEKLAAAMECAQQAVTEANAALAAGCAASLASNKVPPCLGMVERERPMELDVSGSVMRRPDDVRRIFNLYEDILTPFLQRIRLIRWVVRRWYCCTQDRAAGRAVAKAATDSDVAHRLSGPLSTAAQALARRLARALDPEAQRQWTEELNRRIRKMRKLKFERWGRALYDKKSHQGEEAQDWKVRHLVVNAEGQVSINNQGLRSMFMRQQGQLEGASVRTVVSMRQNPARFWPCRDQRVSVSSGDPPADQEGEHTGAVADSPPPELCHVGHAQQCGYHSQHNSLNDFFRLLDPEFLNRVVSTIKTVKNPFVEPEMVEAINHLLSDDTTLRTRIDGESGFFRLVREGIESQAARGQGISLKEAKEEMGCDIDEDFSAETADTCAIVRWATVAKSATWLMGWRRAVAFGLLRIAGLGLTESDEVMAAIAVFSHEGFVSEKHQNVHFEPKVSEAFEFLVRSTTITQLTIVRFVYTVVLQPLMQCMSENNECSERMAGMDSVPRRLLLVLTRGIFVSTGEWSSICRLGHRSHGAEFQVPDLVWRQGYVRLLCGSRSASKIRRMLGNDWGVWGDVMLDKMAYATHELVTSFRVLAAKQDPVLPQMAEGVFETAYNDEKLYGATDNATRDISYALRMLQLQILAGEVMRNVIDKLTITLRHDLYGAKGFMAGMYRSLKTFGEVRRLQPGDPKVIQRGSLVYAHPMAGANAVITLLMGQEIKSHFAHQFEDPERSLDFFPAFAGGLWSEAGLDGIRHFLGVSDWHRGSDERIARWGQHHNSLARLKCVDIQGVEQSGVRIQVEVELPPRRPPGADEKHWNWVSELPRPLAEYPTIFKWAELAAKLSESGKPIEGAWSWPAKAFDDRPNMGPPGLNGYFTMAGHKCPGLDPASLAEDDLLFEAAKEVAQFHAWSRVLTVDKVLRSLMAKDYKSGKAAAAARSGGWSRTNHGGEYRRDRYANPTGKRLTKTSNTQKKQIEKICQRMNGIDPSAGVIKPRKPRQPRARGAGCGNSPADSGRARLSLKETVILARANTRAASQNGAGRRRQAVTKTHQPARRLLTGQGGDEDDWAPASCDANRAVQSADTERRCTRQRPNIGPMDPSAESLPSNSEPFRAPPTAAQAAVSAPDPGQFPGCEAVSEASAPSDENHEMLAASHEMLASNGAALGAAPATTVTTLEHDVATAGSDSDRDVDDIPLQARMARESRDAITEGCSADSGESVVRVPAAAALPVSASHAASGQIKHSKRGKKAILNRSKAVVAGTGNEDSDDEVPIFLSTLNPNQITKVKLNENPWSMDFAIACSNLAWYGNEQNPYPVWLMKERDTAVYGKGDKASEVTITRRASPYLSNMLRLKECRVHPGISFVVSAHSEKNYYLLFDNWAGACLVMVDKIMPPDKDARNERDKWSETFSYRRVFRTDEAARYSKGTKDKGLRMGNAFFRRKLIEEEAFSKANNLEEPFTTYHVGDVFYTGDIRTLVGVVRWKSEGAKDLAEDYFPEYLQAELVITGADVVQNQSTRRRS